MHYHDYGFMKKWILLTKRILLRPQQQEEGLLCSVQSIVSYIAKMFLCAILLVCFLDWLVACLLWLVGCYFVCLFVCVCVCVCVRARACVCACACVCKRERERDWEREGVRQKDTEKHRFWSEQKLFFFYLSFFVVVEKIGKKEQSRQKQTANYDT